MLASIFTACSERWETESFGDILNAACLAGSAGLGISQVHCSSSEFRAEGADKAHCPVQPERLQQQSWFPFFLRTR